MIVDLAQSSDAVLGDYDLCIVGSGPAGLTVASELAHSGLRLIVLESGRARTSAHGDALREVECAGIEIKSYSRERVLGGASTTWAGLSAPLDELDFAPRPFLPAAAWPIARESLLPYWRAASERYRFAPLEAFGPAGFAALRAKSALQPSWTELEEKVFLAASEPQDFGREQRGIFERDGVDLALDATVVELVPVQGSARVASARVRTSRGRELSLGARVFVLATGGIENARLLLASRSACAAGLGNEHDQVGRWLMNHPKNYHGILQLARPLDGSPYFFGSLHKGFAGYGGLRLKPALQAERGVLNSYVRFEPLFPWSDNEGVESLVSLAKRSRGMLARWKRSQGDQVVELRDYSETGDDSDLQNERRGALGLVGLGWNVLAHAPSVASYAWYRAVTKKKPLVRRVRLRNFMEMEPSRANRVTLAERRDVFGTPLPRVEHRPTELDRRSLVHLHEVLAREFERAGVGRLESNLGALTRWPIDQDASHHMGTTRMGRDPRASVVDPDLALHSVPNVFLAGASVFPSSGCANPTYTLVALSIRLAEHLRERVSR